MYGVKEKQSSTKLTTLPSDPDWQERGYSFSLLNTSSENVKAPYFSIMHLFADLNLESSFSFTFTGRATVHSKYLKALHRKWLHAIFND